LAPKILPSLLLVFDGLKRAYQARAQDDEEEESEDDDEDCEGEALSSDEDEIDEFGECYLKSLKEFVVKKSTEQGTEMTAEIRDDTDGDDSDDDDDSDTELDETALESYTTPIDDQSTDNPIDEFVTFQQVMTIMSTQDKGYYSLLVNSLSPEQQKNLQDVMLLAELKIAQIQSKQIERQGGYAFSQHTIPTSFQFNKP